MPPRRVARRLRRGYAGRALPRLLAFLVALCGLTVSGVASASRPASEAERAAVADKLAVRAECVAVTLSTVDLSWALVRRDRAATGCDEAFGNGFAIVHRDGEAWSRVADGSDEFAPCAASVPVAVGHDLGVCRVRRAYLLCADRSARARRRRFRPRACNTLAPRQPFATAVNLAHLRWRHWGEATATARGIERGFHLPLSNVAARVRAYGRRKGCHGDFVYTRVRVSSRFGTTTVRLPTRCPRGLASESD